MQPLNCPSEFKYDAASLQGPSDLYQVLLTIKHGFGNGSKLGCYTITKAQAKRAGIPWDFVTGSVEVLGLKIDNRTGIWGHSIYL